MKDSTPNQLQRNLVSFWGIRGYRKNMIPLIILNRLFHKFNWHWDSCGRLTKFSDCYGVCINDCTVCKFCYEKMIE